VFSIQSSGRRCRRSDLGERDKAQENALVQVATRCGQGSETYNDPKYLRLRHGTPEDLIENLAGAGGVIGKAVE